MSFPSPVDVTLSFQGKTIPLSQVVTTETSVSQVYKMTLETLQLDPTTTELKVLFKGKKLDNANTSILFPTVPKKTPKLLIMATSQQVAQAIAAKKSDPTIRGLDQEKQRDEQPKQSSPASRHWGPQHQTHKDYKFVRLEACTWQSFGHRPIDETPHAFEALNLLEKLSTDPGIVAIMKERELVVNTLGEMDPIDDRLMQKQQAQHPASCLLGYNTNHGLRIDIKLRTDDLKGFRPYPQLIQTLIHEISHNWIGEHDLLFWTNVGQMRAEYLYCHKEQSARGVVVQGRSTAQQAGLTHTQLPTGADDMAKVVLQEFTRDMAQHGLHPNMMAAAIRERCVQLEQALADSSNNQVLGNGGIDDDGLTPRERALAAAERRAQQQKDGN